MRHDPRSIAGTRDSRGAARDGRRRVLDQPQDDRLTSPPPRNLGSGGVCGEYDGGGPDDDEVSLATQAHGLAGGKPFSFLCFSSSKQTRCWPNLCVSLAGIAVACLALRRCAPPPRQMQALLGLWYRRWSQVLWKRVGADWAGDVVFYIVW